MAKLPLAERVAALRTTEVRVKVLAEHAATSVSGFLELIHSGYSRMYPLSDPLDYEPTPDRSVAGIAAASGVAPAEVLYDLLLSDDGARLLYLPLMNYANGNLDDVREMITSPNAIFGLSDAGAHCNAISDGYLVVYFPHMLVHPAFQGQGVGRQMMAAMLERYSGFHQKMLVADGRAIGFYRSLGFVRAGKTESMWIYGGDEH